MLKYLKIVLKYCTRVNCSLVPLVICYSQLKMYISSKYQLSSCLIINYPGRLRTWKDILAEPSLSSTCDKDM